MRLFRFGRRGRGYSHEADRLPRPPGRRPVEENLEEPHGTAASQCRLDLIDFNDTLYGPKFVVSQTPQPGSWSAVCLMPIGHGQQLTIAGPATGSAASGLCTGLAESSLDVTPAPGSDWTGQ